jgi:sulfate adenylyltransferase subunit 1
MTNAQKLPWKNGNNKDIFKKKPEPMNVLKIATAGSVDDGKSTLIGRLLYDTNSLTIDKLEAIREKSEQLGYDYLDFSLATDGLVAEREQGITIDVAHIYFSTPKRSYIIADTPGHIEYTRNMVTGASTSQAAIVLIDARKGVVEQTYRHFFINNLLRIKHVIVGINKMDLVNYAEKIYQEIKSDFETLMKKRDFQEQEVTFIPISALNGDNVIESSSRTPWYKGLSVLEHMEELKEENLYAISEARFPVQYVIRPKTAAFHDFRAYAGKVYGNEFRVGDEVVVLPSQTSSKIKEIFIHDSSCDIAPRNASVSLTLEDDLNTSRGDMIVKKEELPISSKQCFAILSWMDQKALEPGNVYTLQHGVNKVLAKVSSLVHKIHPDYSGVDTSINRIHLNDIALVDLKFNKAIHFDAFKKHRSNGSFILIDRNSNNTVAVGFIQ